MGAREVKIESEGLGCGDSMAWSGSCHGPSVTKRTSRTLRTLRTLRPPRSISHSFYPELWPSMLNFSIPKLITTTPPLPLNPCGSLQPMQSSCSVGCANPVNKMIQFPQEHSSLSSLAYLHPTIQGVHSSHRIPV